MTAKKKKIAPKAKATTRKPIKSEINREQWLNKANIPIRNWFKEINFPLPAHTRISCGFAGGRGGGKFIGQCWAPEASNDRATEMFVSPVLEDPVTVLATLIHEDVHAAVGLACKHRVAFKRCAVAIGLEGKMTATVAGEALTKRIKGLLKVLPPYPHAALNLAMSPVKKQGTRMLKAECRCGYTVRITRKWLDEVGAPHCPNHGEMEVEDQGEEKGDGWAI